MITACRELIKVMHQRRHRRHLIKFQTRIKALKAGVNARSILGEIDDVTIQMLAIVYYTFSSGKNVKKTF